MGKKTIKDKSKNLDKILEQLIRTNLYINICCNIYEQKENVQSVSSSAVDLLYSELEKLDKINYAKAICILSDFEDFMYLICEHVKYKDTMTMISIQERIHNDKNIRFVLENAVKRLKDNNINLKEIFDFLIDSAYGVSKFISLNFLEGVIASYMMLLASYMIKIKNNKFLGLVEKDGVFKAKYGNEQILSKDTLIKLSGIEDKIKFIFKNKVFVEFFNDFLKLPQSTISLDIAKDKKVVNKLGHGFEYEKDRYVLLKKPFNSAYPFIQTKKFNVINASNTNRNKVECEFMLADNNLEDILNNRKYAIGKNGAIIEFINKNKAVDFIEVLETEEEYYFKVRYFNINDALYEYDISGREESKAKINSRYIDNILSCKKEKVNNIINEIVKCGMERALHLFSQLFREHNYIFVHNHKAVRENSVNNQEYTNAQEHKIKQGFMLLNCLSVLYCDIKNREVKIYSRKVEEDSNGTRVLRDTYRTAFIRKLHTGWQISDEAKNNAERLDVILPEGYTFVREHIPVENKEIKRVVRVRE